MAVEDFTTYTEVDPNSRLAKTATRVIWTDLTGDEDAFVYVDKGANYFADDFTHLITANNTALGHDVGVYCWVLTNVVDSVTNIYIANGDCLAVRLYGYSGAYSITLTEIVGGAIVTDAYSISLNTAYYLKIVRDESFGANGKLYCYIYSDTARTTPLATLSITLAAKRDFRYIHAANTGDSNRPASSSGYSENLELFTYAGTTPTVTILAMTDVAITTATGNGNISDIGGGAITAYGHCWKTKAQYDADGLLPTTSDSATTNTLPGAGPFASSLTSLAAETSYIIRAYAINSFGTSYSGEIGFATKESGGGQVFPTEAISRVTNLIHRYHRIRGEYTLEIAIGEVISDFGLPEWTSKPISAVIRELEQVGITPTEPTTYPCPHCTYVFSTLEALLSHIEEFHGG